MAWGSTVFRPTATIGSTATWVQDITQAPTPAPTAVSPVSPAVVDDIQDQIDDITDSLESEYATDYVFDQFDYFISTHPFYFHWEVPLGMTEIVSASVSFEVKDYRNTDLTDSRYAITGDAETRPVIKFYVSEDKGCLFGNAYGPYTTDMRAIDITGDLTGEGIKIIKFETDVDVCVTARVFLRVKVATGGGGSGTLGTLLERPEVRTLAATSIIDVSATLNGDIISVGKGSYTDRTTGEIVPVTCTKRGFKYGLTMTDTWDTNEESTYPIGSFGISATGLTSETDYYFRAYADNQYGRSYGEYMKLTTIAAIPKIAFTYYTATQNYVSILNNGGELIRTVNFAETTYSTNQNGVAVDEDGNIYIAGRWSDKILKLSNTGTQLLEVSSDSPMSIAIAPDGSIWNYEYSGGDGIFIKRNASTLAIEDSFSPAGSYDYQGMAFDSDGYLYAVDWLNEDIIKYDVSDGSVEASRALTGVLADRAIYSCLAVIGTMVVLTQWYNRATGDYFKCPTDLSINFEAEALAEFPTSSDWVEEVTACDGTHFIVSGDSGGAKHVVKYKIGATFASAWTLVWDVTISATGSGLSVAAYPF